MRTHKKLSGDPDQLKLKLKCGDESDKPEVVKMSLPLKDERSQRAEIKFPFLISGLR